MPFTKEGYESYLNQINRQICKKKSSNINTLMIKVIIKLKTTVTIQVSAEVRHIYDLKYSASKENPLVFTQ